MRISHTLIASFNFFNGTEMIIILNKHGEHGELETGTTNFKLVPLLSLFEKELKIQ